MFVALGLGLAIPFLLVAFVPAFRTRLPRPGPWMVRLQRFLAIPMAATAVGCLWLLHKLGAERGLLIGAIATALLIALLTLYGVAQKRGRTLGWAALALAVLVAAGSLLVMPKPTGLVRPAAGADPWSEARVAAHLQKGKPVFVYFTADWCLTCKANEAGAIDRDAVRSAFRKAGVKVVVGDWTNGDPAITRFLESRGRAGVPLYLWYEPGKEPEELPQILTPGMLASRAAQSH